MIETLSIFKRQFLFQRFRLTRLFCWLLLLAVHSVSYASITTCSGNFQENWGSDRGVKLKGLCTDYEAQWTVNDDTLSIPASPSGNFCLIAYKGDDTANNCDNRKMRNVNISITGKDNDDVLDNKFVLGGVIPVTITLYKAYDNSREPFTPSTKIQLKKRDDQCVCSNYQYNLEISVNKDDILKSGYTGTTATGHFSLNGTFANLGGTIDFSVTLNLAAAIQISGLDPMDLNKSPTQTFCVFAVGTDKFSLQADSDKGNSDSFILEGPSDDMGYTMTVTDGNQREEYQGNDHGAKNGWQASGKQFCSNHTLNNMSLTINLDNSNPGAGVYTDKMTLTVTPD